MANPIVPNFNPSLALLGGWPFSQTAGDGFLGNKGAKESNAQNPPSNPDAVALGNAQAENSAAGGRAGRII
jgi:hypothetical protein